MCSINFLYNSSLAKGDIQKAIEKMTEATKHRGPDSMNVYTDENWGFGVDRLEIIGGVKGKQPISDEEKNFFLICNGEIFNYRALKKKFFPRKKFQTASDCEIILHLYKKFGKRCVEYLEGQYAFIIFDKIQNRVFVARDHYGIIPLFYYLSDDILLFASEIKSILATGLAKNVQIDAQGIAETQFFYGPIPPRTCFTGMNQLPPGFVGTYNLNDGKFTLEDFRSFSGIKVDSKFYSVEDTLVRSVKRRLQGSSIPGVYLSGGLDSSIIGYLVKEISKRSPIAFGISFLENQFDESYYQNLMAEKLKIPLIQIRVTPKDIMDNLISSVRHAEMPLIRTAPIPMYLLSKAARKQGVKYVLCGEGADELFLGYPVFLKNKASYEEKWGENYEYINWFRDDKISHHLKESFKRLSPEMRNTKTLRLQEINTKLSQYLLTNQGDRMSMAHGVEQRFPYLDSNVTKLAFKLDDKQLVDEVGGKATLRKAFKRFLPEEILSRKKQGYLAPDALVIPLIVKNSALMGFLSRQVTDSVGIFDYAKIEKAITRVSRGGLIEEMDSRMLLLALTTHILHFNLLGSNR